MNSQRGHINENNLDTLAVTCIVHEKEIAGEWLATRNLSAQPMIESLLHPIGHRHSPNVGSLSHLRGAEYEQRLPWDISGRS
jgi:hypothetical protein